MRLATCNVENLFLRPVAMSGTSWEEGRAALEAHAQLGALLAERRYSRSDRERIAELLAVLGLDRSDEGGRYACLRQHRGRLVRRGAGGLEVVARGRSDWVGWVELEVEPVDGRATENTARVIGELAADVLAVVEVESLSARQNWPGPAHQNWPHP